MLEFPFIKENFFSNGKMREREREREQRQRQRQSTDRQIENKALLLMTFSIIMRHIFHKNFIKVPQVVRKI